MTKKLKKSVTDPSQMSLFDILKQERAERLDSQPGSMCISAQYLAAVKQALKQVPKSRETIADEMTYLSGRSVTVAMINNWAAESHPHDLPAELEHIFCHVTGCDAPMKLKNDKRGLYTLPAPDALRAETKKIEEDIHKLQKTRQKYLLFLQEMEGKRS